jgi:subtilase family serine protease
VRPSYQVTVANLIAALVLAVAGGTATTATVAHHSPDRVTLPTSRSALLGQVTGPADPTYGLQIRAYLAGRDPAGRLRTAWAVSTPGDPEYAHFLSPAQYQQRFGADQAQIDRVSTWLTAQGMTVTAANEHYVAANTTVAQADAAFATDLSAWVDPDLGDSYVQVAPAGDVSVPVALGPDIATVTGLVGGYSTKGPKAAAPATREPASKARNETRTDAPADSCSHWWGEHTATIPPAYGRTTADTELCGYTPNQMQTAYGVTGRRYTANAATVAILLDGWAPTMEADANRFFQDHGLPGFAPGQYSEDFAPGARADCVAAGSTGSGTRAKLDDDGSGYSTADYPEEAIDVETVHMIAPDARVVFASAGCDYRSDDFLDAANRIVDRHLADVVSDSWPVREDGTSPADAAAWELTLQRGAVEGIGFNFSSGDYGDGSDDSLHHANVPFPSSDPWATAVGGTSLALDKAGRPTAEYGWGFTSDLIVDGTYNSPLPGAFVMGSGGGPSGLFAQPSYQRGVTRAAQRMTPDISADAAALWLIGYTGAAPDGGYAEVAQGGGTSGSSPIIAALEADVKQATGHALGFANPALYRLYGTRALHDVLPVDPKNPPLVVGEHEYDAGEGTYLTSLGLDGALLVRPGFDEVTGMGTPTPAFVGSFR